MDNSDSKTGHSKQQFSGIRSYLWPIYRHELPKFLPIMVIFFLISINYHLLRIAKDSLIITAPNAGAEVLPFLKVWVMLPSAIIEAYVFTRLVNFFSKEIVFYIIIGAILLFIFCFLFFIYPNKELLYLDTLADYLKKVLPAGCSGLIAIIRYWMYTLFYVLAESWSFMVLTVLLWGFANDVTSLQEASRFYALFGFGVNFSGILVGEFSTILSSSSSTRISAITRWLGEKSAWDETLNIFLIIILICGILALILYRRVVKSVISKEELSPKSLNLKVKPKMSIRENIRYVAKSKYLICIMIIVLSYNVVINFTEVLWKSQLHKLYPDPQQYTAYFSKVVLWIGIIATIGSAFISGNLIRKLGWRFTALITPFVFVITGLFFFYFIFFQNLTFNSKLILGMTPLALSVFFGSLQNVLSRSSKYTVYDNTKEMAFIPLDEESKIKGKSAIDGIGTRLGKSGAALILQILIVFFNTLIACSPIIFLSVLLIIPVWILAIFSLDKKFQKVTEKKDPLTAE